MEKEEIKKTAIIVLNYNNYQDTINCLASIKKHNSSPVVIYIVDNKSTNESVLKIKEFIHSELKFDEVILLESNANLGYACGNNIGIKEAMSNSQCDYIMILNNDTLFVDDIIPHLRMFIDEENNIGIVSPLLYDKNGNYDLSCARKGYSVKDLALYFSTHLFRYLLQIKQKTTIVDLSELEKNREIEIEIPSGSCMMMSSKVARSIQLFDKNTFLYYEENILFEKEKKLGLKNYLLPYCRLIHLGAGSTNSKPSDFLIKCNINSSRYFVYKILNSNWFEKMVFELSIAIFWISHKFLSILAKFKRWIITN